MIKEVERAWHNDALWIDAILAGLLSIGLAWLCLHDQLGSATFDEPRRLFLATLAAAYGSILGFNVTAISILALVSQSESIKLLRSSRPDIYKRLLGTFASTIWLALASVIIPVVSLLVLEPSGYSIAGIVASTFVSAIGFARLARSVHRLFALLALP